MASKRALLILSLLLAAALPARAQEYKVYLLSPWAQDSARKAPWILSTELGPAYPGAPMTAVGDGWYVHTWNLAKPPTAWTPFYFQSYIPSQYNAHGSPLSFYNPNGHPFNFGETFLALDTREIWIIPQAGGKPPIVTDIPQVKKVAYLFNPWPISAPMARAGASGVYSLMRHSSDPARCGWYRHYFVGNQFSLSFKALIGSQTYGQGGLGSAQAVDLASAFATADTVYLVPDPVPGGPPRVLTRFPEGVTGTCSFPLAVTVRDFSKFHPDFEKGTAMGDAVVKGMVQPTLGADKKPVKGPRPHAFQSRFEDWFRTVSTHANKDWNNHEACRDLPLSKDSKGYWTYDSYFEKDRGYFPIDDFNPFNQVANSESIDRGAWAVRSHGPHNFHFCMEMHAQFEYRRGQVFKFTGDDDVWVFIDNKLAIDLGGAHQAATDTVNLDALGLAEGNKYDFDMFYCERQTTGSNLLVQTSIYFEQEQTVFTRKSLLAGEKVQYDIREIISGDKSCGAVKGGDTVVAASIFRLSGPSVSPAQTLPAGVSYGGIAIDPGRSQVTVDTAKMTGLKPGVYTLTYTSERSGKGGFLQFTVGGSETVEFMAKPRVDVVVGTAVPVTVQAMSKGSPDRRAAPFRLVPSSGLAVYEDSALTRPVAAGRDLATDSATGTLKLFVSSGSPGVYDLALQGGPNATVRMDLYSGLTFTARPQVATPVADPKGGRFFDPPTVRLSTATPGAVILYTLDGSDPAQAEGGSTRTYAGPILLTGGATLKAIAVKPGILPSGILTEIYVHAPPARVVRAWVKDADGDGRIESAVVEFDKALAAAPARLAFTLADQRGVTESRTAAGAQMTVSGPRALASFTPPFPFGLTSVANAGSAGQTFPQDDIPLLGGPFAVDDSVAPVILSAEAVEPDSLNPFKHLRVELSESAAFPLESQTAFVFKKESRELLPADVRLLPMRKTGERSYLLLVDSLSPFFPVVGDSLALATEGEAKDERGNVPARKLFVRIGGTVPKPKPVDLFVTFPNGRHEASPGAGTGSIPPSGTGMGFIPVDGAGIALSGSGEDGKCPGCPAQEGAGFVGPVFHLVTPGPVEYVLRIFTNTGEFVAEGKGRIREADLPALTKRNDASGVRYLARVVWTGRTGKGGRAGTGAYILLCDLLTGPDPKTGAGPSRQVRKIRFGLLRG